MYDEWVKYHAIPIALSTVVGLIIICLRIDVAYPETPWLLVGTNVFGYGTVYGWYQFKEKYGITIRRRRPLARA